MSRSKPQHKGRGRKRKANNGQRRQRVGGGSVRIIGGRWRGSRLPVAAVSGLRPSGDRVRETLFNWLAGALAGARVLDMFAGTGALGLEAASRGAAEVVLVERQPGVAQELTETAARLSGNEPMGTIQVVEADVLAWLADRTPAPFDLVLIDPPFDAALHQPSVDSLAGRLAEGALVYVEMPAEQAELHWPAGWALSKRKTIGEVEIRLLRAN